MRYGGKKGDDLSYRFYGKYFNRGSSFHADGDNFDTWQMGQSGGFRADWDADKRNHLTLQGVLYKGKARTEIIPSPPTPPPFLQTIEEDADLFGASLLGRWKARLQFKIGHGAAVVLRPEPTAWSRNYREFRNTFDLDFQHHLIWTWRQELTWGLGYRLTSNLIDSIPTIVFDPTKNRTDHLASAFIQNQVPFSR